MKIAVLYDSKYGNTKKLGEFLAEKAKASGYEVKLFRTKETRPEDVLSFGPEVILVGSPTHVGGPTRTLGKYIKKVGKLIKAETVIKKAGVFNCNNADDVCEKISNNVTKNFPDIQIYDKTLPVNTGTMKGENWEENWEIKANEFIQGFLSFLS